MFGVLLDVSGSMQQAYARDRSHDGSVRRTHAVLTTTAEIVRQEVTRHNRHDSIFTCAFGLVKPTNTSSCDLIPLLEALRESRQGARGAYDALIELAREHDASHAERWIRQHLTELEAILLNQQLRRERSLIPKLIEKLPSNQTSKFTRYASIVPGYTKAESGVVHRSEAYVYAQDIVAKSFARPNPKSVQYVSKLMDDLLKSEKIDAAQSSRLCSTQDKIQELVDIIEPYIYGGTPMCEAMADALSIFRQADTDASKVLFILSDGISTDGDPLPFARKLRELGVHVVTCFLTSDNIENPKCLYGVNDLPPSEHAMTGNVASLPRVLLGSLFSSVIAYQLPVGYREIDGRSVLHEMSSVMKNTHTPVSCLVDAGWELSPSGESCLFVQANSLEVVDQFCKVMVSQMTQGCDALIDILGKVDTAMYINQTNADFIPKKQVGGTCYANAVAAVLHLAMHRIVGREVPDFYDLREQIISAYGKRGANTKVVLEKVCPEYRLHFQEVGETGARKAINKRRPVVVTFWLHDEEWTNFTKFFDQTKKGVLKKSDVNASKFNITSCSNSRIMKLIFIQVDFSLSQEDML